MREHVNSIEDVPAAPTQVRKGGGSTEVRLATLSDLPQLLELEAQWDSEFLRSSEATLRQRLELHPGGQFVAFGGDGTLLAAMYTQRVASLEVVQHGPSVPARSRPRGHQPLERSTACSRLLSGSERKPLTAIERGCGGALLPAPSR